MEPRSTCTPIVESFHESAPSSPPRVHVDSLWPLLFQLCPGMQGAAPHVCHGAASSADAQSQSSRPGFHQDQPTVLCSINGGGWSGCHSSSIGELLLDIGALGHQYPRAKNFHSSVRLHISPGAPHYGYCVVQAASLWYTALSLRAETRLAFSTPIQASDQPRPMKPEARQRST